MPIGGWIFLGGILSIFLWPFFKGLIEGLRGDTAKAKQDSKTFDPSLVRRESYQKATSLTLKMVSGLSEEQKSQILNFYAGISDDTNTRSPGVAGLIEIVGDTPFRWAEWDYWQPICIQNRVMSNGMRLYCAPYSSRQRKPPLKAAEVSPTEILQLLDYTIFCRANVLADIQRNKFLKHSSLIVYDFEFDRRLADMAENKSNPWKYKVEPKFPGGLASARMTS